MLTSSANQYLRPEYLSPLPTTLDANKSPLALLAKTCSNIGIDSPNNKPLILDKSRDREHHNNHNNHSKDHHNSDRKKSGTSSANSLVNGEENSCQTNSAAKLSFKPYDIGNKKSNNFNNNIGERNCDLSTEVVISEKKTPTLKVSPSPKSTASTARTSPSSGKNSPSGRVSTNGLNETKTKTESHSPKTSPNTTSASNGTPVSSMSSTTTSSALSFTSLGLPDMRLDSHKDSINSLSNLYKTNPFSTNCCPINGIGGPTPHLSVDKTGAYPSIYPPLNYSRMKAMNGGQPLIPNMCRDPYCNGSCQLSIMQNAALLASAAANSCNPTSCPNGCNQCDHQRLMSSALAVSSAYPHLNPTLIPSFSQAYASGLYSGMSPSVSSLQRPPTGNVCNWIAGDNHCGKRFANSEELLQHLRTHTSSSTDSSTSVPSLMNPSLGSSLAHMHYSTAGTAPPPSLTTAAGLRRTYPTSLSPLSNRFHPYKPSVIPGLGALPSIPSVNPLANTLPNSAALSMYYPYGLYSGRIGPPVHP